MCPPSRQQHSNRCSPPAFWPLGCSSTNRSRPWQSGVIDVAQLHGSEDDDYIARLRALTGKPIFRAFKVKSEADLPAIENCAADLVLLDSGAGTGKTFDWSLVRSVQRPYFLAGGLDPDNVADAIAALHPYGVDVSSGIETDGVKDESKMAAFVAVARKEG